MDEDVRKWALRGRNVGLALVIVVVVGALAGWLIGGDLGFGLALLSAELVALALGLTFIGFAFSTENNLVRWPLGVIGGLLLLAALGQLLRFLSSAGT